MERISPVYSVHICLFESEVPGVQVSQHGTIFLLLKGHILELTIDGGVYLVNLEYGIKVAISACGTMSAMEHPKGKVFEYTSKVEIQAANKRGIRYAKMWKKGVSFTTDDRAVTFLLDAGGPKTTVDWFLLMEDDLNSKAFYFNSQYGRGSVSDAVSLMHGSQYWFNDFDQENWKVGNVRISQSSNGSIRIYHDAHTYKICLNPTQGAVSIKNPQFQCTASLISNGHLFVRKGDRRMHYDGNLFVVRNGGQSAAIDENNQLKLY
ncbi:uncharacterized protein LOC143922267 [Arctopsyche grandis]|uniref:uncharacterized protein LOC143922263 n=1 Tax=Arctopsyche grandis TaxID=121162 RepID=UPI00406D8DEC